MIHLTINCLFISLIIAIIPLHSFSQELIDDVRVEHENRAPYGASVQIVRDYFNNWAKESIAISDNEYHTLDSINKMGYSVFEKLATDSNFIGININNIKDKYILLPGTIRVGIADNFKSKMNLPEYSNLKEIYINNFRPRVKFKNKVVIYYNHKYQASFPKFAEKHGVKGFLSINSYLMSNYPRYYETAPIIRSIIYIKSDNKYCIEYEEGSYEFLSLIKFKNGEWIKIEDISITTSD